MGMGLVFLIPLVLIDNTNLVDLRSLPSMIKS
jgi:hypothetical protein